MQHANHLTPRDTCTTPPVPLDYARPMPRVRPAWVSRAAEAVVCLGIILLLVSILMPNINRARPQGERIACAANLRYVGQSIQMYANEHRGAFPDTLDQVVAGRFAPDVRVMLCPACEDTPARGATPAAVAADLTAGGHLSYVYVGKGLTFRDRGDIVLAYEHATNHLRDDKRGGGNVLFADGHVEWHDAAELRAVIDWHAAGNGPMMWGKPTMLQPARQPESAAAGTRGSAESNE